jgi:hypothetical protein
LHSQRSGGAFQVAGACHGEGVPGQPPDGHPTVVCLLQVGIITMLIQLVWRAIYLLGLSVIGEWGAVLVFYIHVDRVDESPSAVKSHNSEKYPSVHCCEAHC